MHTLKVLPDGPLSLTRAAAVSSLWCHLTSDAAVALATKRGLRIKSDDCDRKWNEYDYMMKLSLIHI